MRTGKNFKVSGIGEISKVKRATLHEELGLTGAEVSVNNLPAGTSIPFVHAHKQNEEVYIILKGNGQIYIDGEEFAVVEGDILRLDPAASRCVKADGGAPLSYICVQSRAGSLDAYTETDGILVEAKPSWL
jgi:mannose-6-phosphate isomerase-like protein (cupin superfamily)